MAETIKATFPSGSLDFHFFQYSDFDLSTPPGNDIVSIASDKGRVFQVPGVGVVLNETAKVPAAHHAEAGLFPQTLNEMAGSGFTNLNDHLQAGPGDATWAFQWDAMLTSTRPFALSKDKMLRPVPEPAAIALLGGVLLAVASKLRRRPV